MTGVGTRISCRAAADCDQYSTVYVCIYYMLGLDGSDFRVLNPL
jgi:hypothetical protein